MKNNLLPILLLALVLTACNHGASQGDIDVDLIRNPNSATGYNTSQPMPIIAFDCDQHDFGRITQGESLTYSFHFANTGNSDLVISGCTATCGCTIADYPRNRIAPGKDGYITVTFNSQGKIGQQYQEITVSSNAQPSKNVLKIIAQVAH